MLIMWNLENMIIISCLETISDKKPDKKMNEYSVPFLLDSHMVRLFWSLPHDGHEGNEKLLDSTYHFL